MCKYLNYWLIPLCLLILVCCMSECTDTLDKEGRSDLTGLKVFILIVLMY